MDSVRGLMDFIAASPTAFHAVANLQAMLAAAGFETLNEGERWALRPGGNYCVTRNQSSLIAFRLPDEGFDHFQIVASHSDSPCFKLKPIAGRDQNGYALLNVEKYGGMIMSTWLDRPLSVAGRAVVSTETGFEVRLVNLDRDLAMIPNMPIHFNRSVNDGVKLNPQVDMMPVYGKAGSDYRALIAETLGVEKDQIASADLFLINRDAPRLWGMNQEFISSPRLDDLECAYTSAQAFLSSKSGGHADVLCVFDNEEVGSGSRQGADSSFLEATLRRITAVLDPSEQAFESAAARSFMVSADNAHAVHPNHADQYDTENRVSMNGGVVVKFAANQKYTSDGVSQAVFEGICRRVGVPVQRFANRSDIPGGSTLGNIANTHASMMAVDIGLAQLAMHSANECAGTQDVAHMIRALKAFYETDIDIARDGIIRLG